MDEMDEMDEMIDDQALWPVCTISIPMPSACCSKHGRGQPHGHAKSSQFSTSLRLAACVLHSLYSVHYKVLPCRKRAHGTCRSGMSKVQPAGQLWSVFKFSSARSCCYKINNMRPARTIDHSIKYTSTKKLFYVSPDGSSHTLAAVTLGFVVIICI